MESWRALHWDPGACWMPLVCKIPLLFQTWPRERAGSAECSRLLEGVMLTCGRGKPVGTGSCLQQQSLAPPWCWKVPLCPYNLSIICTGLAHWRLLQAASQEYFIPAEFPMDFLLWDGCALPSALRSKFWCTFLSTFLMHSFEHFRLPVRDEEPGNVILLSLSFCLCLFGCLAAVAAPSRCWSRLLNPLLTPIESGMSWHT